MKRKLIISGITLCLFACSTLQAADTLDGRWRLTEIAGTPITSDKALIGFNPAEQSFSAGVGCNSLFGNYSVKQDKLTLSSPATTLIGCSDETGKLENKLVDALEAATKYQIRQNRLEVYDHSGNMVLQAVKQTQ